MASLKLSLKISPLTYMTACAPFTPSNSEQRSHLTYYRDCWHVISRCFFCRYSHHTPISWRTYSSLLKEIYNPKAFITHARLLRQAFAHCGIFLAAASRRSLGRISVPMWPITLSGRLPIVALVGHYPPNKLIGRRLIQQWRKRAFHLTAISGINHCFQWLSQSVGQIIYALLTSPPLAIRCKHLCCRSTCMLKTSRQRSL